MNNINYSHFEANLDFKFKNAFKKHKLGKLEEARADYNFIIQNSPSHYEALNLLASTYMDEGKYQKSIKFLENSILIKNDFFLAIYNLAICYMKLNEYDKAIFNYKKCILLKPNNASLHADIGLAFRKDKKLDEALKNYNISISINPDVARSQNNRGNVFVELKEYEKAIVDFRKAIEIRSNFYQAFSNLGNTYLKLNLINKAKKEIQKSISLNEFYSEAYINMGMAKILENKLDEAIVNFNKAISIDPDNPQYFLNKSMLLLLKGDFKKGWELYEWRLKLAKNNRIIELDQNKKWDGNKSLNNKTILLISEQGLGDTIQFSRFVKLLSNLGANIIFEVQKPLINLLSEQDTNVRIISKDEKIHFDYFIPLLSLPKLLKINELNIPFNNKYIQANKNKIKEFKEKNSSKKKKIGIAFSGNNTHKNTHNRDIKFKEMSKILSGDYEFYCIQKDVNKTDLIEMNKFPNLIWDINYLSENFSNTAALISCMDMIITVDTSLVHLSGAMGIKTLLLLPYNNDWRWMKDISHSPWYRSIHILRQQKLGCWDNVILSVCNHLNKKRP